MGVEGEGSTNLVNNLKISSGGPNFGRGGSVLGPIFFDPKLAQLSHVLSFASLFQSFPKVYKC